jgi:hypothetical protein
MDNPQEKSTPPDRSAVVINIQSWATPIIGVVMLVIGLLGGYFGRPLITSASKTPIAAPTAISANPTTAVTSAAPDMQKVMADLIAQTRHFQGDANAPVTIIEISDYQ